MLLFHDRIRSAKWIAFILLAQLGAVFAADVGVGDLLVLGPAQTAS